MIKASDFVKKLRSIAEDHKTLYVYGAFGAHLRSDNVDRYINQYAYNRRDDRLKKIKSSLDVGVFGFDCVCLVKGVLWGWYGNLDSHYGGASYESCGVPDVGANRIIELCKDVSEDFSSIEAGELLWIKDHCGVYIGDGLAVECTPIWDDGVQITAVNNIQNSSNIYNTRNWKKHGKLPYVDYTSEEVPESLPIQKEEIPAQPVKEAEKSDTDSDSLHIILATLRKALRLLARLFWGKG